MVSIAQGHRMNLKRVKACNNYRFEKRIKRK